MLKYSRHAKRRMALYGISEEDVALVVKEGDREALSAHGKVTFRWRVTAKSK